MSKLLIIGPGRVGTGLALALQKVNHAIIGAVGTSKASPSSLQFERLVGVPVTDVAESEPMARLMKMADIILLCVRDGDIGPLAEKFANRYSFSNEQMVCHTAGALGLDVLHPVERAGARIGCLHPLQTFADPVVSATQLSNTHFAVTGDAKVSSILMSLVNDMGATAFFLQDEERGRYHAGAALASNALVALVNTAASLMPEGAGLESLLPLVEGTILNLRKVGLPAALTGPIERGDIATVRTHLSALAHESSAKNVYQALATVTVDVASAKGSLSKQTKEYLLQLLHDEACK